MSAPLIHIESSPSLPQETDVVVIGGGVVGVFTAYYLARRGVKVALLEKGRVAAEQSSRNWGWCRQQIKAPGCIYSTQRIARKGRRARAGGRGAIWQKPASELIL